MPGQLPPSSAFTYAVEFSADEAMAAGATSIEFDHPVQFYVEDFIGFPTGVAAPVAFYDKTKAAWSPLPDGRVIEILNVNGDQAVVAVEINRQPASAETLAALGINADELQKLASLYRPGQKLWRVSTNHFSAIDVNWPPAFPPEALKPQVSLPENNREPKVDPCATGSIIRVASQTLQEKVSLVGTPFSLYYSSDRVPGREAFVVIPVSGDTLPRDLDSIELEVSIAGRKFVSTFPPSPNLSHRFIWDGLDAYGRKVLGSARAMVKIKNRYPIAYAAQAPSTSPSFGLTPVNAIQIILSNRPGLVDVEKSFTVTMSKWDARSHGLGGWGIDQHHAYDPIGRVLYRGDGSKIHAENLVNISTIIAGTPGVSGSGGDGGPSTQASLNFPADSAVGPDGSIYIADGSNFRIRKITPDGIISNYAGNGVFTSVSTGSGGDPTVAGIAFPAALAVASDGSLLVAEANGHKVRRISPDGSLITDFAGSGVGTITAPNGDGGLATNAVISKPRGIAIAPDNSVFISEGSRIRKVDPNGVISTVAGMANNFGGFSGDGGPARNARLSSPSGIFLDTDGALYIADQLNNRIRKVTADGTISTVAGNGQAEFSGDGGLAVDAGLNQPITVAVDKSGNLLIGDLINSRIRMVTSDGLIRTFAGTGLDFFNSKDTPALTTNFGGIRDIVPLDSGDLLVLSNLHVLWKLTSPFPRFTNSDFMIASQDGGEIYLFDSRGRHLETKDATTGLSKLRFTYGTEGTLESVSDVHGNSTQILRNSSGDLTAIRSPDGLLTKLTVNATGYLDTITNPNNETLVARYDTNGLLLSYQNPRGAISEFQYDSSGRLTRDDDALDGFSALTASIGSISRQINMSTAEGRVSTYTSGQSPDGAVVNTQTNAAGSVSTIFDYQNGQSRRKTTDDSVFEVTPLPDPRFGMQASFDGTTIVTLPSGLQNRTVKTSNVVLNDPNNQLDVSSRTETVSENGKPATRTVFSASDRSFVNRSSAGRTSAVYLNQKGQVARVEVTGLLPVDFAYDDRGRPLQVSQGTRTNTFRYGSNGFLASITNGLNQITREEHDGAGRVLKRTLPDGRAMEFAYDGNGNLASVTPPGKPKHEFTYSLVDLINQYRPPALSAGNVTTLYQYNRDREVTRVTRPDGKFIEFSYHPQKGQLLSQSSSDGQFQYGYSQITGQLLQTLSPSQVVNSFSYDGGLLKSDSQSGGGLGASVTWNYNNSFQQAMESVSGGSSVSFTYDNDHLLTGAGLLTLSRGSENGLLVGSWMGVVADAYAYNMFGEVSDYSVAVNGQTVYSVQMSRDELGRISDIQGNYNGTPVSRSFVYDAAGRLITEIKDNRSKSYRYDSNSNRISDGVDTGTFDAQDRLLSYGTKTYTYSQNGEVRTKSVNGQTTTFNHDAWGTLRSVTMPDGKQIEYMVDGLRRRVGKKVAGALVRSFAYKNQLQIVAEYNGSGQLLSQFVYGSKVNVPDFIMRPDGIFRIISDHVGSPLMVINVSSGEIVQMIEYDSFGAVISDSNPGFQPFGFAGGLYDVDTKLVHFGARSYDPEVGRFISKDPILFSGGDSNLYGYVMNDPVNLIDPDGLKFTFADSQSRSLFNQMRSNANNEVLRMIDRIEASDTFIVNIQSMPNFVMDRGPGTSGFTSASSSGASILLADRVYKAPGLMGQALLAHEIAHANQIMNGITGKLPEGDPNRIQQDFMRRGCR